MIYPKMKVDSFVRNWRCVIVHFGRGTRPRLSKRQLQNKFHTSMVFKKTNLNSLCEQK